MMRESRQKDRKVRAKGMGRRKPSDVTDRCQAESETRILHRELAFFSRHATLNELTAWLAHELNQPLASILCNAQAGQNIIKRGDPDSKELRDIFADIVADVQQASEEIRSIRSMLRRGVIERKSLSLNDLIKEILPIGRNDSQIGSIAFDLDFDSSLPSITGDRIQLQQVILNLVVNAFEAMDASERPRKLILRTRHAGSEVVLDVVDSGIGIPHEKIDSIFDPLVTTKADALGMGLSLSRSIVIGHNGRLWAENNADRGATFHVALPVESSLALAPAADGDRQSRSDSGRQSGGLKILIADDGEAFRRAVSSILSELPELKLLSEAADGAEAVKMAAEQNPDLILLDVGLPTINGVEAAARIRIEVPDARLLFLTQHDSPDFVDAALRAGALGYVLKVDAGSELLQAAMAVLRGERYISSGVRR